jgi:hypothetical protein
MMDSMKGLKTAMNRLQAAMSRGAKNTKSMKIMRSSLQVITWKRT